MRTEQQEIRMIRRWCNNSLHLHDLPCVINTLMYVEENRTACYQCHLFDFETKECKILKGLK